MRSMPDMQQKTIVTGKKRFASCAVPILSLFTASDWSGSFPPPFPPCTPIGQQQTLRGEDVCVWEPHFSQPLPLPSFMHPT